MNKIYELQNEIKTATKQELANVISALVDFIEHDNMENLYEGDMDEEELLNTMNSRKEAKMMWLLKTTLKHAK